ncbi:MAG: ribosomal protein [Dehalococcoidia bacterium]|nr:ribosomal protein [Dehalococcoidia bacterium]
MPSKRGFTNIFKVEYQIVNVGRLDTFEPDTTVTREALKQVGIIKSLELPVKILGDGQLSRRLTVEADRFSVSAAAKIEAAGGQAVGKIDA